MTTVITVPTKPMHTDGKSIADAINRAVVANGKTVQTAAVHHHGSPQATAKQISAATGQPATVLHHDGYSIARAIDASIALM
ncbi:MAG: hypothetical protein ACM3UO_00250 [Bacillota bacterium]